MHEVSEHDDRCVASRPCIQEDHKLHVTKINYLTQLANIMQLASYMHGYTQHCLESIPNTC